MWKFKIIDGDDTIVEKKINKRSSLENTKENILPDIRRSQSSHSRIDSKKITPISSIRSKSKNQPQLSSKFSDKKATEKLKNLRRYKQALIEKFNFYESTRTMYRLITFVFTDILVTTLSIVSTFFYILQGINPIESYKEWNRSIYHPILYFEYFFTISYAIDFVKDKVFLEVNSSIWMNREYFISVISLIPGLYFIVHDPNNYSFTIFHIIQILKSLRILKIFRILNHYDENNSRKEMEGTLNIHFRYLVSSFLFSIICFFVISGSIVFELNLIWDSYKVDNNGILCVSTFDNMNCLNLIDATYFVFQTYISSPFKDVSPSIYYSRYQFVFMVVTFIFFIFYKLVILHKAHLNFLPWKKRIEMKDHIIIIGTFSENIIFSLLSNIIASRKGNISILVVKESPPSDEMISNMMLAPYTVEVDYLQADVYSDEFPSLSNVKKAKSIFILNNSGLKSEHLLIQAICIASPHTKKIVISQNQNSRLISINSSQNIHYLNANELRLKLMCLSIHNKGILSIFSNLFLNLSTLTLDNSMSDSVWVMQYSQSLIQNLIVIPFPEGYMGYPFLSVAKNMYLFHKVLVIGVRKLRNGMEKSSHIIINPTHYVIEEDDEALIITNRLFLDEKKKNKDFEMIPLRTLNEDMNPNANIETETLIANEIKESINKEEVYVLPRSRRPAYQLWRDNLEGQLEGHIVLFCKAKIIIKVLKEVRNVTFKPIFWFSNEISDLLVQNIQKTLKDIYILEGDCLNKKHLMRASLSTASLALIINGIEEIHQDPTEKYTSLLANILDECFDVPYLVDLEDFEELNFMPCKPNKIGKGAGSIFYPQYISGNCFVSSTIESLASNLMEESINAQFLQALFSDEKEDQRKLLTLNAPLIFVGRKYSELFKVFISNRPSMIPIALITSKYTERKPCGYRNRPSAKSNISPRKTRLGRASVMFHSKEQFGKKSNKNLLFFEGRLLPLPLSLINPDPNTIIEYNDKIIVLTNFSSSDLHLNRNSLNDYSFSSNDCVTQRQDVPQALNMRLKRIKREVSIDSEVSSRIDYEKNKLRLMKYLITSIDSLKDQVNIRKEVIRSTTSNIQLMKEYYKSLISIPKYQDSFF